MKKGKLTSDGKKKCGICNKIQSLDNFYRYKNIHRSYCKKCNLENTRKFRANPLNKKRVLEYSKEQYYKPGRKENKFKVAKIRLLTIKQKAVEYKGGKCFNCGYDKCIQALEFHHINPEEKDVKLNTRGIDRKRSFEKLKIELDKCILVCANCHKEIHYKLLKNG